jgi:hypothetical protein
MLKLVFLKELNFGVLWKRAEYYFDELCDLWKIY